MRAESIEMQTPGQAPESAPTREEWKAWCRKTCFSQKARGKYIILKIFYKLDQIWWKSIQFCTYLLFLI